MGPPYIRVLGMSESGRKMLRRMKRTASLPIITKCGAAFKISEAAASLMRYELIGAELWEQLVPSSMPGTGHKRKIII